MNARKNDHWVRLRTLLASPPGTCRLGTWPSLRNRHPIRCRHRELLSSPLKRPLLGPYWADFYRFLPTFRTFLGDFTPDGLDPRRTRFLSSLADFWPCSFVAHEA